MSALLLLGAGGGMAADSLSPDINMDIAAGGSVTVAKTLHLDQNPAKADIVIAVDTTASMQPAIDDAKADATNIVSRIQSDIPGARFAIVDFQDYPFDPFGVSTDHPYLLRTGLTSDSATIQSAINDLTLGDGNDIPEAYNRVFYEAYADPALQYDSGAARFLIVLGDSFPHDRSQATTFPDCPNTTVDDPGRDGILNDPAHPSSDDLTTKQTLDGLIASHTTLSFVTYNNSAEKTCEGELASYTGGHRTDAGGTATLADNLASLVHQAAAQINGVTFRTDEAHSSWLSFTPPTPYGPFDVPAEGQDINFSETITVPPDTPTGTQSFDVHAIVDGVDRATEHVTLNVKPPLANLSLTADQTSVPVGLKSVPIANIPPSRYAFFGGSTPVGSVPVGSTPVGSTPVGSVPVGSVPVGSTPVGSVPVGSTGLFSLPVGSTPVGSVPVGSVPVGSTPLANLLLSQLPLGSPHTWGEVLACSPLAQLPPNAVTLDQVINDTAVCADGKRAVERLNALPLSAVPFVSNLLAGTRLASLLLGTVPVGTYTVPGFSTFTDALTASGGDTTGITNQTSALGLDMAGHLGSTPVGSVPVGSTPNSVPVGSTPVGSVPVGSVSVLGSRLADVKVRDMAPASDIVRCAGTDPAPNVDCSPTSSATLGDAAVGNPNAIKPTATLGAAALQPALAAAGITIDDLIVAILTQSSFPFEQLPIQGLQDVPGAGTGQNVTYRLAVDVDCSVASSFKAQATLPAGFFPVAGSAKFTYSDGGTPISAPDPAWDAEANRATWTVSPCAEVDTSTRRVTVSFDAYAGLKLGSFTADGNASYGSFSLTTANQAPVKVTENWESNDDPLTAPTVGKDQLLVFHISASGDQDFFRFPLAGLARGTRISVFMSHIPSGADFDLTLSKPATSFSSTPVGSVPVGSTPIEDRGVVVDNSGQALPSETLQDIPVGSVPVGSTPVGSTPVGSTSTNRGSADEAAGVVLQGEGTAGNYLTIGASGYNGSSSSSPAVIRIKVTPPPPLPASCPARSFAASVSSTNQGTLPSSLPATTKTVFLVNKQRLAAMYGISAVNTLISKLTTLAARSEVSGSILFVDGDPAVRNAYAAWDATGGPCSVDKANAVVKANNDVLATYRNSLGGLPNLHYVVLIGNDEAIPAGRIPDPVTLSPELDEAADLAFTTNGLTTGNALYNSEALNNILSDGVYGAFSSIQWLGHDLPLPQVSVARLVEDPTTISNLVDTYTLKNGTINPTDAVVTGYDFLSDGATAVKQNIATNVPGTATSLNANSLISPTWTAADITSNFFGKTTPPGIASLNAHYSHRLLQPAAGTTLVNAGAVPSDPGGIVFTMGCHSALNVSDQLSTDTTLRTDWAQKYIAARAAGYIGNSGFGYGDSESVALSERLMAQFAKRLHSNADSIGEQWVTALNDYFMTAGAYDVYDEKVMDEATFFGLPFWHFSTPGTGASDTPLTTTADPITGTQSATVSISATPVLHVVGGHSFWDINGNTAFGLYRALQPIVSKPVPASLPARGVWIKQLATTDFPNITPKIGMPTIDLAAHEPIPNVQGTFFPASMFSLEKSIVLGKERPTVNITGQFRPNSPGAQVGTERVPNLASVEVFYGNGTDFIPPLISTVSVTTTGTGPYSSAIQTRVTDDSGNVAEVAALVNDGTWHYLQLTKSTQDPTIWEGTSANLLAPPEVFIEATDGLNTAFSANKGSNFTSAPPATQTGPTIFIKDPTGPYAPNQLVLASFFCSDPDGVTACDGTTSNGGVLDTSTFGLHTFTVTATDSLGNQSKLQRTYYVQYAFKGFFAPINNPPVLNVVKAGSTVPIKFSLSGFQGNDIFAPNFPSSEPIACDSTAVVSGLDATMTPGGSSLQYFSSNDTYQYGWKTQGSWAGTCRALLVKTKDGAFHRADFQLTK